MRIYLNCPGYLNTNVLSAYNQEQDGIIGLLYDVCEEMSKKKGFIFEVSGFGDEKWPVDELDLAILLEQIPLALQAISNIKSFRLDLCNQGVQRVLKAVPCDGSWKISCESYYIDWDPDPNCEILESYCFYDMLNLVLERFLNYIKPVLDLNTTLREEIKEWLRLGTKP